MDGATPGLDAGPTGLPAARGHSQTATSLGSVPLSEASGPLVSVGLWRASETDLGPGAWSLHHPHTDVAAGVMGGVRPGRGFSLMWPRRPYPTLTPKAGLLFACPLPRPCPPSPRMTRVDLRNYLERIYSVPVATVRTRVQHGGCLAGLLPVACIGSPPSPTLCATDYLALAATPWV